ncbi:bifunctional RNase H/acid phosphatase [Corynebacterium sp. NML120713]|uniref:bifunctional RNase H/acid phosphatase n=1 Tax=Corynebacterium sp. NML120713 TaxID=1906332 RepID=UPI0008FB96FB|nr:bifunctional RNase H/acid phosphatase [Corynebacterium sp. NML120713]OIR44911.1 bifunctional RNase H/acid phosphatase [Corynebacterium sp. NML120713]
MKVAMFCDGGSRGNPGVAGSGAVVYGPDGETLAEVVYAVGKKSTNNVAEYHGLIEGLKAAIDAGADEVAVSMDSKLVVEQMNGRWKIKHPDMQQLALEAKQLARTCTKVTYTWVPRAKNKKADELSNVAMDAAAKGKKGLIAHEAPAHEALAQAPKQAAPAAPKEAQPHETASPGHWSGTDAPRTRFVLLRHGQTEHSARRVYSGQANPPLTEIGQAQARRAADALAEMGHIDVIVASPQARAQQTAQACADALGIAHEDIVTEEGFREVDFGDFEALSRQDAQQRYPEEFEAWQASAATAPPNGESLASLHRRVTRARLRVQERYEGKTILLVAHTTPIKSVIRQGLNVSAEVFKHLFLDLASISVVEFYGEMGVVRCVNDVAHHRK